MLYTMIIFIHYYYTIGRSENQKSENIDDPEFYFHGSIGNLKDETNFSCFYDGLARLVLI